MLSVCNHYIQGRAWRLLRLQSDLLSAGIAVIPDSFGKRHRKRVYKKLHHSSPPSNVSKMNQGKLVMSLLSL
ncbi:hypothetical protein GYMLUDRAFT_553988 [Collybiopsis luxurians FD-317 M1]|uniref:Unplaced genomic scaffold GYMLUscaffold_20, whole genome shotgun sequence n=1 Tax=Collybiopsis luxurians FD-317 M1 TaxID=944289 RepID=A0A0D0C2B4_9AGAR|nr:hypothetical protein GYMLUDRAFT_553988 [Collybiopsis luxurians FD-317 M1]